MGGGHGRGFPSMSGTLFDRIVRDEIPSWKVWEDSGHLAFLTPFPSTPGVTVVIPKANPGDYLFALPEQTFLALLLATRTVARILERAFDVSRVAMVFEGTGVPHVHAKLYPLHGPLGGQTGVWSSAQEFHAEYVGHLTTADGPRLADAELDAIRERVRAAAGTMGEWR